MKFIDEYRDPAAVQKLSDAIRDAAHTPHTLMEICGGQTHSIIKYGIDELLPDTVTLIHGPGCPVCVTPQSQIDKAIQIASRPNVIFTSFGDMLRVPGTHGDLFSVKAQGGDVRLVYSPLDAVKIARANPDREVVFFSVGFETTAPATAMAVVHAKKEGLKNFSLLTAHVLVPPAMRALLSSPQNKVEGFLAAGHVCTVMGFHEYHELAGEFHVPMVVTGFEPLDILQGIFLCLQQFNENRAEVENQYSRSVTEEGNATAQAILRDVFRTVDREWRGLGTIPMSGMDLSEAYAAFDAETRFGPFEEYTSDAKDECISGLILQGIKKPHECPAFGTRCIPEHPLGAPMVSSEGACAAYYRYRRT